MTLIQKSGMQSAVGAALIAYAMLTIPALAASAPLALSEQPVFLQSDLPPNFVVTLDDSGSMQFGFTPESVCTSGGINNLKTRRYRSAWFNSQYYDPRVYYPPAVKEDGTPLTTSFGAAYHNGFAPAQGSINLNNATYRVWWTYNPALGTIPSSFQTGSSCSSTGNLYAENPDDFSGSGTNAEKTANRRAPQKPFYYVYDPASTACAAPVTEENDACYRRVWVSASSGLDSTGTPWNAEVGKDETQNFANWYSFYRVRNLAAITGASRAFLSIEPTVRVAWQALNKCNSFNGSCAGWGGITVDNRIRSFSGSHRQNFYNWLFRLPADGGTPLRSALVRAGEYYKTSGITSPYAEDPQVKLGSEWGCRVNYTLAMTDGLWNSDTISIGNTDNTSVSKLPDDKGTPFAAPKAPYSDDTSNTLADIAFKYWATDLRTDLNNNVPPYVPVADPNASTEFWNAKNDPATWQHMVTFTVGFGLKLGLKHQDVQMEWGGDTYSGSYADMVADKKDWPAASANSNTTVADLWHAAVNSRGQFFPADQPDELRAAFESVINRVQEKSTAFAAVASNSGKLSSTTQLFQPLYNPGEWSGDLRRVELVGNGSLPALVDGVYPAVWSAKDILKTVDHTTRNVVTTVGGTTVAFKDGSLSNLDFLKVLSGDSPDLLKARLNWLRGDSSQEGTDKTYKLRVRKNTKLGDIVNSSPVLVGTPEGYVDDPSFFQYMAQNCSSSEAGCTGTRAPVVYVGANDGMLHGFDAKTGAELIAYVPEAVQDRLKYLPSSGYTHKFYVDGTPVAGNAKINGTWKTVLAGGLGAGGRGIYALDVTNPAMLTSSPTSVVIWDFTSKNDGDLGYTFGEPLIRTMANGRPAVIFGNGYNSDAGKAILFIKYLDNKTESPVKIEAGAQTDSGLSAPSVADTNGDGKIDTAYAGDLKGNVWRFDLIANTATKLYTAMTADNTKTQSITTAPGLMFHPRGGVFVVVGSGQALQSSDLALSKDASGNDNTPKMTIYGLWDTKGVFASQPNGVPIPNRSKLEERVFTEVTDASGTYRTLKGNTLSWYDDPANVAGKLGWYVELPDPGEKIVFPPVVRSGAVWFLSSVASSDTCSQAGSSWLMKFNALTGMPIPYVFNDNAPAIGAKELSGVGNFTISQSACANGVCAGESAVTSGDGGGPHLTKAMVQSGRVNWRDITQ